MIYENLEAVSAQFEVFLFDAYGVFWNGGGFYKNSKETMRRLVENGKTVVVVSNATLLHEDMVASYERKGLIEGEDYTFMVSSGEVLRSDLLRKQLGLSGNKFYTIGAKHKKMFADTDYTEVENLEDADFVFCGVPFVTAEETAEYPQYQKNFLPAKADEYGKIVFWDSTVAEPFAKITDKVVAANLPSLNANPDYVAQEAHPLAKNSLPQFVVRNGTVAEMLRQKGGRVLEYGKPHANIYEYVFAKLAKIGKTTDKSKICMVGDTVRTDIKGAVNCGIAPILCVQTGVTALEISKGNTVKNLCEKENIDVEQIIEINSVGGK